MRIRERGTGCASEKGREGQGVQVRKGERDRVCK
jgi:hypothetical protein